MDIFRTLLCVGLVVLLWHFQFRGIRPIRDFILWGILYPFHFVLMSLLILVVWGVVGADFGLQGLFLNDDPLTQLVVGAAVMLLFAALIVHYSVLDTSARWWNNSLTNLIEVLRDGTGMLGTAYPVRRILRNGFLEQFGQDDIEAVHDAIRHQPDGPSPSDPERERLWAELGEMLRGEPFRLLVSPAILFIKGFMLVFLVGVVPTIIIPAFSRDPMAIVERLPWLLGVILGNWLGIVLACWTTRWAARAAGWDLFEQRLLQSIRDWAELTGCRARTPMRSLGVSAARSAASQGARVEGHASHGSSAGRFGPAPRWVSFLLAFYIVHFIVNVVLPSSVTSRWIEWPERTYITVPTDTASARAVPSRWQSVPWAPALVLLAEAAAAWLTCWVIPLLPWRRVQEAVHAAAGRGQALMGSTVGFIVRLLSNRRSRYLAFLGLAVLLVLTLGGGSLISAAFARSLWRGLLCYAALGSFLLVWLVGFRLATRGAARGEYQSPPGRVVALLGLLFVVSLYLVHISDLLEFFVAAAVVTAWVVRTVDPDARIGRTGYHVRPALVTLVIATAGAMLVLGLRSGGMSVVAKLWLGVAILLLGASALSRVASQRPALLYPLTLLLGFLAFAIPYNALDERWQSTMPAAASIACMVALMAAVYTIIVFLRPKSGLMTAVGVVAAILLWNGNAWFVAPNEFKTTFPKMESYYALPIYLDSRDYFRDTTPSTVRLRNREVTGDLDRMDRQGESERLATAYFRMIGQERKPDGGYAIVLSVEDVRGRLRAIGGDEVRLSSEEWFTTVVEGQDCIVLAEEPFYRKIFRWFRYRTLHMIRNGIIRGPAHRLAPFSERRPESGKDDAGGKRAVTYYEPITGPGDRLGLRLIGLTPALRAADAQYVLISMDWTGRVMAVEHSAHRDTYKVEFAIPPGVEPLTEEQLAIMGTWLERCHLDTLRPTVKIEPNSAPEWARRKVRAAPAAQTGDCFVLEDARAESPVPVGVYLADENDHSKEYPEFAAYRPTPENLTRRMHETPAPVSSPSGSSSPGNGKGFTLRLAHDRGVFACTDRSVLFNRGATDTANRERWPRVALYNAGRLRPGDRLIMSWSEQGQAALTGVLRDGGSFEVVEVGVTDRRKPSEAALPTGYRWTILKPISEPGADRAERKPSAGEAGRALLVGEWQLIELLNNTEVLLAWKGVVGNLWAERKPKLVLVTVSGGGIRASVWTSVVLRKLEQTLGGEFPYHVRLITGASGGMVGGSYYATSLRPPPPELLRGEAPGFSRIHGATTDAFVDRMATDQLDAVAGRMVFADLLSALNPFLQRGDRGKTLEQTWIRWTGGR